MSVLALYEWGCLIIAIPVSITFLLFRIPNLVSGVIMILTWPVAIVILVAVIINYVIRELRI